MGRPRIPLEQRFELHQAFLPSGCRVWTGALTTDGYGIIRVNGKNERVHRVSYEYYVGPIPDGLTIDHVRDRGCVSRACFWPDHLEPVTQGENVRRGDAGRINHHYASRTECKNGHSFEEFGREQFKADGTFKQRVCMKCQQIASAEWEARRPPRNRT